MSAPTVIVALYPPAVRERWGAEIGREVAEGGARSWPDAIAGAARLWLHPDDWPQTTAGQTRRVLAAALFAVTAVAALLLRSSAPAGGWCLLPILAGTALAAPLPPRHRPIRHVVATAARTLPRPAAAAIAMLALADSGLVDHPHGPLRVLLLAYYWATLTYIALQLTRFAARLLRIGTAPTRRRLRLALLVVGAGTTLAAAQSALGGTLLAATALALLAAAALHTRQNLRTPPPPAGI
ncbi:hypothetical protein Dvina_25575 [Dactylosporangium vinaceum]|uniref:Integral membrane protein n=1 Tax=Dactylosporangium vinaceum TaxID=53362 RepID=A0ABV5MDK7_9ACTN|nr:hypothetical protein [Dactylosporangium vinaceum]UAC01125.1 hypothetical protein Dvina_25575 [Dactylosporangium vinaceum]